jgi:hypothetical protein
MTSAIVLKPGKAENKSDRLFVVVKIPTIECAVFYTPEKLPKLNVFQKGAAYFLLAGLGTAVEISKAMGITDSDFTTLLLRELVGFSYAEEKGNLEFVPTRELSQEFKKTSEVKESHSREMFAFLPLPGGKRMAKIVGPFSPAPPTEVDRSISPAKVAVGTVGKPVQVDCLVSEWVSPDSAKVDRGTAKEWILGPSKKSAKTTGNDLSTRVEVLSTKSLFFVLQCQLIPPKKAKPDSTQKVDFLESLVVRFPGDEKGNTHLAKLVIEVSRNDPEFAEEFLGALGRLKGVQDLGQTPDRVVDDLEAGSDEYTVTRKHAKKKPLTWLVELLISRLRYLGTAPLESCMVPTVSVESQVAHRLVELGSDNRKPPVPPLQTSQLEEILKGEFHNELDVSAVLGAWLLLERRETLNQLIQLNPKFIDGVCSIFINLHVEVSKDMRETFEHLGSIE